MCVPSRVSLACVLVLAISLGGCGGSSSSPGGGTTSVAEGAPLRGLEARRNRAQAVLAAVERAVGEDGVMDLTFDARRFTVLTSWVTQEQRDHPANALESGSVVRSSAQIAKVCRAVRSVDPDADAFVAASDGVGWLTGCPHNRDTLLPR